MATLKDRTIGGFRILAEIQAGSGAQGTVYKAVCENDIHGLVPPGTLVALKVMPVQDEGQSQWRRLEKRTAELAALRHPNVVRYCGCFAEQGTFNDIHVVVQEFLDGETLKERLARQSGGLDVDEAIRIVSSALEGLVYTMKAGIVHRDLKPGNIFLCKDGSVKLIDFEIAKKEGGTITTAGGNIRGSFDYMAPDFTDPDFHGDERSDVFSMGVVLHEALTGKLPYQKLEGDDKQAHFAFLARWAMHSQQGAGSPIHVSSRVRRLLAHTEEMFAKALAPKRDERYPDFASFLAGLRKVRFRNLRNGAVDYQMLRFVGKGGFGEVFKARIKQTGQLVAVKHLLKDEYAERFRREAKIMKKLANPCFVRFVDFFDLDIGGSRESFLAMAFLDGMPGSSLRDAIKKGGGMPLDARSVLLAFERYARGLHALHESGIFHRDIKPSNLYYPAGSPERAAIMDFGIARDIHGTATSGQVPGTLDYMPPEVVLTDSRGDAGMDVYALGLCLYEALSGKTAYPRLPSGTAGYAAFFQRAKNGVAPSFAALDAEADAPLLALLREMTDMDPSMRMVDAGKVAERIAQIVGERFGTEIVSPRVNDEPETTDVTMTLTPTISATDVDAPTRGTVATQTLKPKFGEMIDDERRAIVRRRFRSAVAKTVSFLSLAVAVAAGAYFFWPEIGGWFGRGADDGGKTDSTLETPSERPVAQPPSDPYEKRRMEISKKCFELINKLEPVETRGDRIEAAKSLMEENKVNGVYTEVQAKMLDNAIEERRSWIVGRVVNETSKEISVDGKAIAPGKSELFKFVGGLPERWTASAPGYEDMRLPPDFDGRMVAVHPGDLVPLPVAVTVPPLDKGVTCQVDGRNVAHGKVMLAPGAHVCEYLRTDYETQKIPFSVEMLKERSLPPCGEWKEGAALIARRAEAARKEKERREEEARKERERQEDLKRRRESFAREFEDLCADEPVATRRSRLDEALERVADVHKAGVISEEQSETMKRAIADRRGWAVGRVANATQTDIVVAGRTISPSKSELFVFKKGVPNEWTASARGYEVKTMPRDIDGRTITVSSDYLVPRSVNMTLPQLEKGIRCFFDGGEVSGSLSLRPGKYSVRYSRTGCEDQNVDFEVLVGRNDILPAPGAWTIKPVNVRFRFPGAGIVCKVNGKTVDGDIMLPPGRHVCRYERDDYIPKDIEFTVKVGVGMELPPCGTDWVEGDGLKALNEAEVLAKTGDWLHVDEKLAVATVKSPANAERRKRLSDASAKQVDIQRKLRQAEAYYASEEYYEYVRVYKEAVGEGHVPSDREKSNIRSVCNSQIDALTKQIDYYEGEIQKGRLGFVRNVDTMKDKRKNLIDWRIELVGE